MKSLILKTKTLTLSVVFGMTILMVGCSKDEMATETSLRQPSSVSLRSGAPAPGDKAIAQIAIDAGFSELVAALSYVDEKLDAGLVNLFLNGTDQYTVFAPTNQAFQNLYSALNVQKISDLPADLVLNVLLYHVAEGRRASNSVVPKSGSRTISTLLTDATFSVDNAGKITAVGNSATITTANISASNGIIHVIDTVILPIK